MGSHPLPLLFDSMEPLMSNSQNSRPTWSHTLESISHWPPTHQSSLPKKHTTNNFPFLKLPTHVLNQPTRWSSVIHDTVNTWLAASFTEVMSCQRMLTRLLQISRLNELFNLSIGAQPVLKSVSTTNHQLLFQVVIWQRSNERSVCCLIQLLLLKLGHDWIINSILCTQNVPLSTGMSEKVWKRENSRKPERIWPLLKRITKKSVLIPSKARKKKAKSIKLIFSIFDSKIFLLKKSNKNKKK